MCSVPPASTWSTRRMHVSPFFGMDQSYRITYGAASR